jgi:hypothetical protein
MARLRRVNLAPGSLCAVSVVEALDALAALGAMPEGFCFCSTNRDPLKAEHDGECAEARDVLCRAGW